MAADDVDLVLAARAGDQAAWAGIYDRYADRLHDFCWSVLRDRDEAADAMHDTFITAYRKLDQLRDPTRLRSWLFAIARNEALAHGRKQKRAVPTDELEVTATTSGPAEAAETEELRALVWAAAAGLADRDRAALDLHLRQGLEGAALGEALGTSASNANVVMSRLRDQVERSLGALLVAKRGRDDCAGLAALLEGWDETFTPLWRKRIARHVDDCPTCSDNRRRMANPLALLAGVAAIPAPLHLRDRVLKDIELISSTRAVENTRTRRWATASAIVAAAIALLLGVAALTNSDPKAPVLATGTTIDNLLPDSPTSVGDTTAPTSATDPSATTIRPTGTTAKGGVVTTSKPTTNPTTAPATTLPPPPLVVTASAGARSMACGSTTPITATTSGGTPPVVNAVLHWNGPGGTSGSKRLGGGPTTWSGNLGPLYGQGNATWWVTAVDSAGTRASSSQQTIAVFCAQ